MKKFCKYLREHVMKIINLKKLIHEQRNSKNHIKMKTSVIFPRKTISVKLGTISITQRNTEVLHIAYIIQSIVYLNKFL